MAPILIEAVSATETIKEPQSCLEEKDNPSILKDCFSSRGRPILHVTSATEKVNWKKLIFPISTSYIIPHCHVDKTQV